MNRSEKIMSLLLKSKTSNTSTDPIPGTSAQTKNVNNERKKEIKVLKKKRIDYNNDWNKYYVSLEDMNAVKHFEYNNSFSYEINQYDMSNLKKACNVQDEDTSMVTHDVAPEDLICHEQLASTPDMPSFVEDSDDSVKDKNYEPEEHNSSSTSTLDHTQLINTNDTQPRNNDDANNNSKKRKTKKKKSSSQLKQYEHKKKKMEKFCIKPTCKNLCKKFCNLNFTETDRQDIHHVYWSLDWEKQALYIKSLIDVKACTSKRKRGAKNKRNVTYQYNFMKDNIKVEVCRTFFLTTLGFEPNNDRRILSIMKKDINALQDKRDGRNLKVEKISKDILTSHVNSFNPCVHHYRRAHAPNRKYLPSDITITDMYKNFTETHPEVKISYETYRNHVTNIMNISFTKLGHEECEHCEVFNLHNPNHVKNEPDSTCETCISFLKHKEKYTKARIMYESDAEKKFDLENLYVSVDLQKVIMLPRLDTFKCTIFCPRLVAYNETFVPLAKTTVDNPVYAVVWHEGISGRKQEDIVSTFRAYLLSKRDAKTITLWLDNCSAQNKNWCLLTFLINIINSSEIVTSNIIFRYFEPGHTYMSADSFHHSVEKSMHKKGKLYDFQDFADAVMNANKGKVQVKVMNVPDFFLFKSHVNTQKKSKSLDVNKVYLKDIVEVMVKRGEHCLFYKTDYDDIDYQKLMCLKSKNTPKAAKYTVPRGITLKRKQNIIKVLGPIILSNRLSFWQELPIMRNESDEPIDFDVDEE